MSRAWLLSRTSTVSLFSYSELFSSWICWEEETNCELLEFVTCLFHFSPKKTEMFCGDRVYFVLLQAFTGLSNNSNTLNPSMGSKIPLKKTYNSKRHAILSWFESGKICQRGKAFLEDKQSKTSELKMFLCVFLLVIWGRWNRLKFRNDLIVFINVSNWSTFGRRAFQRLRTNVNSVPENKQ